MPEIQQWAPGLIDSLHRRVRPIAVRETGHDIGSNRWTFRGASRGRGRARERRPLRPHCGCLGRQIATGGFSFRVTQTANRRELVERAAKAEQVTELKGVFQTAKTLGMEVPLSLLIRADELLE